MRLGTRWAFGGEPPAALPGLAAAPIAELESLRRLEHPAEETALWRWTLTWLEGRARLELDDGTLLALNGDGTLAELTPPGGAPDPEDDW